MSIPRRSRRTSYLKIQAAVSLAAFAATAWGQSVHTWNGGADPDNSWSNTANWVGGSAPDGNDEVHFAGTANLNPFRDALAPAAGYRIFFDNGAGAFTLDGSAYSLFDFGGNNPKIENNSTSAQTINFAVTLDGSAGAGSSAEINPVQGSLVFGSTVTLADPGLTQLRIFGNNGNTVTFNGVVSGDNSVAINQASNVIFRAGNTYTGDTFVNVGTLQFQTVGSSASSIIRLGDITGSAAATVALTDAAGGQTIGSTLVVRTGASGVKTLKATNTSGTNTYSGNLFLDADLALSADSPGGTFALSGATLDIKDKTITVSGAGNVNVSGVLQNSTAGGKVTMSGTGVLFLNGANSYTGLTTVNAGGTIRLANASGLGTTTSGTTVNTGGVLDLNGQSVAAEGVTLNGTGISSAGALINSNTTTPASISGAISLASASSVGGGGSLSLSGVISGANALTKVGTGVATFTNSTNSFGKAIILGGVVSIGSDSAVTGTNLGSVPGAFTADQLSLDGGTIRLTRTGAGGTGLATNRGVRIGAGGGTFDVTSAAAGDSLLYSGTISLAAGVPAGTGTVYKTGANTLRLLGNAHVFDRLVVTGGLWQGPADAAFGSVPSVFTADAITLNGGGISTNGGASIVANRGITIGSGGGTFNASSSATIASVIAGTAGGSFNKTGANSFTLTATNTYDGPTNIYAGRINSNANGALGTGVVSFPAAATGSGTLVNTTSPSADVTLDNAFQLNSTLTIDISSNSGRTLELSGKVSGASAWRKDNSPSSGGTGTVLLSNSTNDFSGGLTVAVGQLAVTANNALGSTAGSTTINSAASLVIRGGINYTAAESVTIGGTGSAASPGAIHGAGGDNNFAGPITMLTASTLNVSAGKLTLDGVITDGASSLGLEKVGLGTLKFTAANAYDGASTVTFGTLLASNTTGSATGTGNILVKNGATFGGTGFVTGNVTMEANASLAPGESIGDLDTGALSFADSSSMYLVELNSDAATVDRTNVAGNVTLGGATLQLSFFLSSPGVHGNPQTFVIINKATPGVASGTFTVGSLPPWASVLVNYAYSGLDDTGFTADGNDIAITITYTPEPTTLGLVLLSNIFLARRRRA